MILAIDIGNTTTSFGVFDGGKLRSQFAIATQPSRTPDEITLQLKALAKTRRLHLRRARQILLSSVVPRMSTTSPHFVSRTLFHRPSQSSRLSRSRTISRSSRGVSANRGALFGEPTTVKLAWGMASTI